MTREEAINVLKKSVDDSIEMTMREWEEFDKLMAQAIDMAIEALSANCTTEKPNDIVEQGNDVVVEPTVLISRADAIEELGEYFDHLKRIDKRGIKRIEPISLDCKGIINKLPSADRPSGEWVYNNKSGTFKVFTCSECGLNVESDMWCYCPNCGADMKGERNE